MYLLPPPPLKLLDLGCGTGWTSILFAKRGYEVTGVDISPDMIKHAKLNQTKERIKNIKFSVEDYEEMNFNKEFDIAIFFDSLHHAEDEQKALSKIYKSLKRGGICICSEPGKGHSKNKETKDIVKKYGVTEKDMPPKKIIKLGRKVGFKSFKVFPKPSLLNNLIYNKNATYKYFLKITNKLINAIKIIYLLERYKMSSGIVAMYK